MGNGESTSRRISMQRSDEGTIQISEDVMLRLRGEKTSQQEPGIKLLPNEKIIDENDLRAMLEKAFQQGISHGGARAAEELSLKQPVETSNDDEKIKAVENYWQEKLNEQDKKANDQIESMKSEVSLATEELHTLKENMDGNKVVLDEMLSKLQAERDAIKNKLENREKELKDEFDKSVTDVQQKLSPLQQAPVCTDLQAKVMECYRTNREKPLLCSQEVKYFADCVQASRLKLMQKKLAAKESLSS